MTTHLCTFSDESMSRSRALCDLSARKNGVERSHLFGLESLNRLSCYEANKQVFDADRGIGYWAWKPALLNQIMSEDAFVQDVRKDDVIVYADAGVEFTDNVSHIIQRMDQDIFLFGNNWEHAHWCKRDIIETILQGIPAGQIVKENPCLGWEIFGKQCQASVIFFRISDYSKQFVAEWLRWCLFEGGRLIDDSSSRAPNHPEFRENRHDQAILTTLAYREGIKLHYWPAVYNRGGSPEFVYEKLPAYASDDYPVLFSHHRKRNDEWKLT